MTKVKLLQNFGGDSRGDVIDVNPHMVKHLEKAGIIEKVEPIIKTSSPSEPIVIKRVMVQPESKVEQEEKPEIKEELKPKAKPEPKPKAKAKKAKTKKK